MSIQETNLKAIADAIRAKTGLTDTIKASEFAAKITAISTGVAKPKWTYSAMPIMTTWKLVCYGNGKFVAVANGTTIAAYSTDGITWTQTTLPANESWQTICYGIDKFVIAAFYNANTVFLKDSFDEWG